MFFFYGTLRENGSNYHHIESMVKTSQEGKCLGNLYIRDDNWAFMTNSNKNSVTGELVTFFDTTRAQKMLDVYESPKYYKRIEITVELKNGETHKASTYIYNQQDIPFNFTKIQNDDWIKYCKQNNIQFTFSIRDSIHLLWNLIKTFF